jgi:alpha-mannosidase
VRPAAWPVALPPGGWAEAPVRVSPAADAAPGDYLVAVSVEHRGQTVRDLVQVRVAGPVLNPGGIDVHVDTLALALRPGERDTVKVELASTHRSPLDGTLELLGPVDTWPLLPQWTVPVRLDGDDRRTVELPVVVPAGAEPGDWWVLARLSGAGQVAYSATIPLTVDR